MKGIYIYISLIAILLSCGIGCSVDYPDGTPQHAQPITIDSWGNSITLKDDEIIIGFGSGYSYEMRVSKIKIKIDDTIIDKDNIRVTYERGYPLIHFPVRDATYTISIEAEAIADFGWERVDSGRIKIKMKKETETEMGIEYLKVYRIDDTDDTDDKKILKKLELSKF